jgi:hypothetical protein
LPSKLKEKCLETITNKNTDFTRDSTAKFSKGNFIVCAKSTDDWQRANLTKINDLIKKANRSRKYVLIWDRLGTASTYFESMEIYVPIASMQEQIKNGKLTIKKAIK